MTATAILAGVALVAVVVAGVLAVRGRRLEQRRATRRAAALERLARSVDVVAEHLGRVTRPRPLPLPRPPSAEAGIDPTTGLPGRAALVDELVRRVAAASSPGARIALGLVQVDGAGASLEDAVSTIAETVSVSSPGATVFRSGEAQLALVVEGGRAEGIAAIAKLEATLGREPHVRSSVVERSAGEGAAELLTRAMVTLGQGRPSAVPG